MKRLCKFLHWAATKLLRLERSLLSHQLKTATKLMSQRGTIPQFAAQLRVREDLLFRLVELNRFLDIRS